MRLSRMPGPDNSRDRFRFYLSCHIPVMIPFRSYKSIKTSIFVGLDGSEILSSRLRHIDKISCPSDVISSAINAKWGTLSRHFTSFWIVLRMFLALRGPQIRCCIRTGTYSFCYGAYCCDEVPFITFSWFAKLNVIISVPMKSNLLSGTYKNRIYYVWQDFFIVLEVFVAHCVNLCVNALLDICHLGPDIYPSRSMHFLWYLHSSWASNTSLDLL